MSYPNYRGGGGAPMGRGYGPQNNYYNQQQQGGPPGRHMSPGYGSGPAGYMPHSYDHSPPPMRGDSYGDPGGFGRGRGGGGSVPLTPPRPTHGHFGGDKVQHGMGRGGGSGSASGFDSGTNSDDQRVFSSGGGGSGAGGDRLANDCEIVVTGRAQQQYGEMVERQLREIGLKVDIMFVRESVKLQEFLKPMNKTGTIFAIVIDPDNEKARSIHFYQFRGHVKPQFHKNVPIPMAYDLILKKYNELKSKEIGIVPVTMKTVFNKLLEEQSLNDNEYTAVVRFLQERRNRQNAFFNRTNNVIQEHSSDVSNLVDTPEGKELKNRILAILNSNSWPQGNNVPPEKR